MLFAHIGFAEVQINQTIVQMFREKIASCIFHQVETLLGIGSINLRKHRAQILYNYCTIEFTDICQH